jgi:hypothetical protein
MSKLPRIASILTFCVFAFAMSAASVEAGGRSGGGHGGGGHGGGGSFHASSGGAGIRSGGFATHGGRSFSRSAPSFSRSAPMIRSGPSARTFSRYPSSKGFVTSRGYTRKHFRSPSIAQKGYNGSGHYTRRAATKSKHFTVRERHLGSSTFAKGNRSRQLDHRDRNLVSGSVRGVKNASMLRNDTWAKHLSHDRKVRDLSKSTFHGKFADKHWDKGKYWDKHWDKDKHWWYGDWHWRHHHPFIAVGWYGSLFWPYAYWDFVDYTFWPYAYDMFWLYAYDDLYEGLFGPYAYEGPAYAEVVPVSRRARRARERSAATAVVCNAQAPALTDWPIQQIAKRVQPNEAQQSLLNDLKEATAKAVNVLRAACPEELPSTPTGRLEAMRKRIATMLLAVSVVRPPLQGFYDSLNDEQKARFNVIGPETQVARASSGGKGSPDLSQVCGDELLKANVPTERIAQVLKPSDIQRTALDALTDAARKSGDFLKANCAVDRALTPPGRVAAMEQRLNAMLEAIKIVQPALENFYGRLTDEQKARFNQLGLPQG